MADRKQKKEKISKYKNQIVELRIEKLVTGGIGISRLSDTGEVVMVRYVLPGELVKAEIVWVENDYMLARAVEILEPSKERVEPRCKYFTLCGGCDFQHIPYEHQIKLKRGFVIDSLKRIGKFDFDFDSVVKETIPSPKVWNYRNTATFKVDPRRKKVGFFKRDTKFIVDIDECLIVDELINEALLSVKTQQKFPPHNFKVRATNTGDMVVHWVYSEHYEDRPAEEVITALGRTVRFRISSESFFQVNNSVIPLWLGEIVRLMSPSGDEIVYDLYSGIGLISFFVAGFVRKVVGVEISKRAVQNANETKELNGIDNVEFVWGDVKDKLSELDRADVLIIDPPRSGVEKQVLDKMLEHRSDTIIYSSCDHSTLARDLRVLVDGGYSVKEIVPVDMFPQTHHIEVVSVLKLEN